MSFHYILEADVEHAPDRIKKVSESVPADFVVSRSLDGRPLSQFKDHSWDLTPYGAKHIFYFDNWQKGNFDQLSETLTNEIKTISWLAQWNPNCVVERTEKASTHRSMVSTLKSLAHIAYYCGCTLESAHASPKFQAALKESIISTIDDSPSAELAWQAVHVKNCSECAGSLPTTQNAENCLNGKLFLTRITTSGSSGFHSSENIRSRTGNGHR